MKFYVICEKSKKTGKDYTALVVDLGYRILAITFDLLVISELSGLSFQEIYSMKLGDKIYVGDYVSKKVGK